MKNKYFVSYETTLINIFLLLIISLIDSFFITDLFLNQEIKL